MKLLKIFSFVLIAALTIFLLTPVQAQDTDPEELANALVEFEVDEINAKSLGIEEPKILPGQFMHNWQLFKENANLFFTFDKEEKINKLEEISNRRLLEAKELAKNADTSNRVEKALERYQIAKEKINTRLEQNPELKEKFLERLDANQLKHSQVLSTVTEKLRDKISEEKINKLEKIKKEDALNWYNANKKDIGPRLEKAIENNDVGSKFKQLKNIAVLEELGEVLPEQAKDKIENAKLRAEEKLATKLANTNSQDRENFEKYINNIQVPELSKQKFISNLKDSEKLPALVKEKAKGIFDNYSNNLRTRFENLEEEEKEKFLDQFENKLRSHPANIQFLESINAPENKERIQNLLENQIEGVKEKIQGTTDPTKLRSLEQNLRSYPVLRRQIQQRQTEVKNTLPMPDTQRAPIRQ